MKKIIWITGVVLGIGGAWAGCAEEKEGDLHEAYRFQAVMAENETEDFLSGALNLETMDALHEHTRDHLNQMRALRMEMMDHCQELDGCPHGGGATGHMSGGMMHGGGYVDDEHMDDMAKNEEMAQSIVDEMSETCQSAAEGPTECLREHGETMAGIFKGMADECADMMVTHMR